MQKRSPYTNTMSIVSKPSPLNQKVKKVPPPSLNFSDHKRRVDFVKQLSPSIPKRLVTSLMQNKNDTTIKEHSQSARTIEREEGMGSSNQYEHEDMLKRSSEEQPQCLCGPEHHNPSLHQSPPQSPIHHSIVPSPRQRSRHEAQLSISKTGKIVITQPK